jgi:hypothetical protein
MGKAMQEEMQAFHHPTLQSYMTLQVKQRDVNEKVLKQLIFFKKKRRYGFKIIFV